ESFCRIMSIGDDPEWIDRAGYSTLVNPGTFAPPTHWRWPAEKNTRAPTPMMGEELAAAADALCKRLRAIHDDPTYKAVWDRNHFRHGPYTGPNYADELARLERAILSRLPA